MPRDWLEETYLKRPILCWVGHKTVSLLISHCVDLFDRCFKTVYWQSCVVYWCRFVMVTMGQWNGLIVHCGC